MGLSIKIIDLFMPGQIELLVQIDVSLTCGTLIKAVTDYVVPAD